jgi:integrase
MSSVHVPKYRRHRGSGQAVVTLAGREVYLGRHGTPKSRQAYRRILAEFMAAGGRPPPAPRIALAPDLSVVELIAAFWRWAIGYYVKDGRPSSEQHCLKAALGHIKVLYGDLPAAAFGPLALKAVRERMVEAGLSRGTANRYASRIKRLFRWAAGEEFVPPDVYHGLQAVDGLRRGRTEARETEPVRPVPEAWVRATLPHLPRPVAAMVELQLRTGMRSGEAVIMRGRDLAMGEPVWQYRPSSHKTEHHGHERIVDLGPRAQAILKPWLKADLEAYLFVPAEAEVARNAARREGRLSPLTPSARARYQRAERRRRRRGRAPGERYTADSYRRAIARGIEQGNRGITADLAAQGITDVEHVQAALIPHWHPHQLRHTFGTTVRRQHGLEAARAMLGHHSLGVTEVYAERDLAVAARVAAEMG